MVRRLKVLVACAVFVAMAQPREEFEAASIKAVPESVGWPPRSGYWVMPRAVDPQRFRARIHVDRVIEWAYGVRDFQVLGGPAWIREGRARFEIQATTAHPTTEAEMRQMVQRLLAERFKLRLRRETREIPVYALLTGRNGAQVSDTRDSSRGEGRGNIDIGKGEVRCVGTTMAHFTEILTDNLERPVVDKTGLMGHYDFTLHYEQSSLPDWRLGPALFSMVQDLGLRLEPQKAAFEMLVIDSVERPGEN
jgi:uncharacterized protein (TIGR03435 family)